MRRAPVIAAALYLALVQMLTAAHAASGAASAPDHDPATCIFHITGDRGHLGMPEGDVVVITPQPVFAAPLFEAHERLFADRPARPPSRGPPVL